MTRDDIVRMAQEAGLIDFRDAYSAQHVSDFVDSLEPFAALVAAAEREACAQICDDVSVRGSNHAYMLAKAIRARGEVA